MSAIVDAINRAGYKLFGDDEAFRRSDARWRERSDRIAAYFPCPAPPPCVQRWAHRTAHRLPRWMLTQYGIAGYVVVLAVIAKAVQS